MTDTMWPWYVCASWWVSLPLPVVQALMVRHVLGHLFSPDPWGGLGRPRFALLEQASEVPL